jgi:hypothetical protein
MDLSRIRSFTHKHCRFKLRSGKEIFGVVWEVESSEEKKLFFASVRDYERFQRDQRQPINVMPLRPEEIMAAESIAS